MIDAFTRLMTTFGTFFLAIVLTFTIALAAAFGFRYYEVYTINSNIENFMSDMLDYAAMHNGFNNPVNGDYSFYQVEAEKKEQYKLEGHILGDSIQYSPTPGNEALDRVTEVSISMTPVFPVFNPFSDDTRQGKTKTAKGVTHGYVKVTSKDKSDKVDKPIVDIN